MVLKLYYPYIPFANSSANRIVTFLIIAPYKYSYLLTNLLVNFLLINIYDNSIENTCTPRGANEIFLESLKCYKDSHMKASFVHLYRLTY